MKSKIKSIRDLKTKIQSVKESKYSILIYILTILVVSIWTIFTPCVSYIAVPIIAIYIPSKLYKEGSFKKLVVAGLLGVLVVSSVATLYHTNFFYSQESTNIESPNNILKEGRVDRIYEDTDKPFNFTVLVDEDRLEANFTVRLNITYELFSPEGSEIIKETYNMSHIGDGVYQKEVELGERKYFHNFAVDYVEDDEVIWEETDQAFGPMTLPFQHTLISMFIQRTPVPILVYLFIVSILWWREDLKKGKKKSTEGLDEKEKTLENFCLECGELFEGSETCLECGYNRKENEKSIRIVCKNCGKSISKNQKDCPYCGEDVVD